MKLLELNPGTASSDPNSLVSVAGTLFFVANDGAHAGTRLWKSDGTGAGTKLVDTKFVFPEQPH